MKKGISPIFSGVIYVAIILVVIGIVMNVAIPAINKSKDRASFDGAKYSMRKIDKAINDISKEGEGSARVVDLDFKKGKIVFDKDEDTIKYVLESDYKILSPRLQKREGDLLIMANTGVSVKENGSYFIIENENLKINISKIGSSGNYATLNISEIINNVYQKQTSETISGDSIYLKLENYTSMNKGLGYTYAVMEGDDLSKGSVVAHVENTWADYDLYITLESGADFFEIYVKDYESKA